MKTNNTKKRTAPSNLSLEQQEKIHSYHDPTKDTSIIISTGSGRLHLVQAATAIKAAGWKIRLIIGYMPSAKWAWLVNLTGKVIGRKHLYDRLAVRCANSFLETKQFCSCAFAEGITQLALRLSQLHLFPRGLGQKWGWSYFGWSSRQYLRNANIFHVRSGAGQGGAIKLAKEKGMKVLVDHSIAHPKFMKVVLQPEYEDLGSNFNMGPENAFWKLVLKDCSEADRLLVNSDFVKKTFTEEGYPAEKIDVVHFGVRSDFIKLKKCYKIKKTVKVLFTGGVTVRKGAHYLMQAFKLLKENGFKYELIVAGDLSESSPILDRYKPGNNVKLIGHILHDNLKEILSDADIYVFPTLSEGCASSVMEALAAGLPVITTRESGAPVNHGETGWIIPQKSAQKLVDAIIMLSNNDQLREKMGQAASRMIAENYTWDNYGSNMTNVYNKLLEQQEVKQ